MSHNVTTAVYSEREGAGWHGIGFVIPAAIAKDPAAIAKLLGATYQVDATKVYVQNADGTYTPVVGFAAQRRDDNGEVMSITSDNRYHTDNRQPRDVFEAFRDELAANRIELSHGAILKGGRQVIASGLLDPEFDIVVGKGDRIRRYVTLATGYDNRNGTVAMDGDIRVVCNNTWEMSLHAALSGQKGHKIASISASQKLAEGQLKALMGATVQLDGQHYLDKEGNLSKALKELEASNAQNSVAKVIAQVAKRQKLEQRLYNEMANATMGAADVMRYFADVLEVQVQDLDRTHVDGRPMVSQKMKNLLTTLTEAYHNAPGAAIASGNVWGAFNAVTFYATHQKPVRDTKGDGDESARIASNMFGDAKRLKNRALALALARVKVAA